MQRPGKIRLGQTLLQQQLLTVEPVASALKEQQRSGRKLGRVLAGDVPVVGGLFRNTANQTQKRELVVLIKPTIVNENSGVEHLQEVERRIEALQPRRTQERE